MFNFLSKTLRLWRQQNQSSSQGNEKNDNQKGNNLKYDKQKNSNQKDSKEKSQAKLSSNLNENLDSIKGILGISDDLIIREFAFGNKGQISTAVMFIDGMVDRTLINENIIRPLMYDNRLICEEEESLAPNNIDIIKRTMLAVGEVEKITTIAEAVESCLSGDTVFLIKGSKEALSISSRGWETRGVVDPETESIVRGPREGFTENLRTNTTLLRRKIKSPDLTLETIVIGKKTNTAVCLAYLKGVVNPQIVEEAKRRLKRIDTDAILESGYIEEFIEDAPFSIFSTIGNSEKPDTVAAKILEGRAAILVDGTPFVLTIPKVFIEGFQSSEDYYSRPYYASLVRVIRFIAFAISMLAPSTYVAATTFHQELIPTPLLFTVASAMEGTPFPAVVEVLVMGVIFEILREAGIRLPRPVGQAISIVGALVIGESAVSAGLIGETVVIVIAITAVASFVVPAQTDSGAILRVMFVILAGTMGGFGIMVGLIGLLIHLASLRSFGTPYLSPLAPLSAFDLKDVFFRVPIWAMLTRPKSIVRQDIQRQKFRLKPTPPPEKKDSGDSK